MKPLPQTLPDDAPSTAGGAASPVARWSTRSRATALARVVTLLAVLGLGGLAAPAAAHDTLTGSTPADGTSVEAPPAAVDLTFSSPPLDLGAEVRVTGPDGAVVNDGDLQIVDTTVTQPLAPELPAGEYSVAWRVTSADGHPVSGELTFTAATGADAVSPAPAATPDPSASVPAETASPEPEPSETAPEPAPAEVLPDADAEVEDEASSAGVAPWVIGLLIALLVGAAAAWAVRRRPDAADRR